MEGFCLDKGNIETRSLLGGGGGAPPPHCAERKRGVVITGSMVLFKARDFQT